MLRKVFTSALCLFIAASFSAPDAALSAQRKTRINMSAWATLDHPVTTYMAINPSELLNAIAGDKFDIRIHPSHTLISQQDGYQAVITGMTPFNLVWTPATPGAFPMLDLFALPGLFPNQATSNAVLNDLFAKYPQFKNEIHQDVVHLSTQVHMRADLHTRTPIRTLADLKGKTIGCQSPQIAEVLAALGASVSVVEVVDAYTSLDKGVIDGMACAWGAVSTTRIYEVAKYHTLIGVCPAASHFLLNRKIVWDALDDNQKKALQLSATSFQSMVMKGNVDSSMDVRFNRASAEAGHEMIVWGPEDMAAAREKFRPFWDRWAEEMEKKGLPGKAVLEDAIRLIDAYNYG